MIFEYTSARTLIHKEWCKNGKFTGSPIDAKRIFQDIAKTLERLASHGISHNCVIPWNILYEQQTGAILTGFGHASPYGHEQFEGFEGWPWYTPPEGLEDGQHGKVDPWSFGIIGMFLFKPVKLPALGGIQQARLNIVEWLNTVEKSRGAWKNIPGYEHVAWMLEPNPLLRITLVEFMEKTVKNHPDAEGSEDEIPDEASQEHSPWRSSTHTNCP